MKFLVLIPARYASTRFPGKPLADLGDKPMIQYVYEKANTVFSDCYVATDDPRIEESVRSFGGKVVMTSSNHQSGTDRCREALDYVEELMDWQYDIVVNVQGDEPFISREKLCAVRECFSEPTTEIATLIKRFVPGEDIFNPNTPKVVISKQGDALYFSRSPIPYLRNEVREEWSEKGVFYKHIGLYAYRTDVLRKITSLQPSQLELSESLEQLRWLENGFRIKTTEVFTDGIAIDTPEDLARAIEYLQITQK